MNESANCSISASRLEETECRCETLVLLCFKQFRAILTQNSRNWGALQLLCDRLLSFLDWADAQCRCLDWVLFLLGFVSFPSLGGD